MRDFSIRDALSGKYDRTKQGERQTLRTVAGINSVLEVAGNPTLSINQKTTLLKSIGQTHSTPYPNATEEEIEADNAIAQFAYVSELLAKSAATESPSYLTKSFGPTKGGGIVLSKGQRDFVTSAIAKAYRFFERLEDEQAAAKTHCAKYDILVRKMSPQAAVNKWFGS